jgi:hypothetical protein
MAALGIASAQPRSGGLDQLARQLSNLATRDAAVEQVVASPATLIPVLLSWTTNPPDGVSANDLNVGLAVAFDRMKTEAAIPFLVRVISIKRFPYTFAPWIKEASSVELEYPAAEALIRIGPSAATAVIKAAQGPMTSLERLLAIFVVGQIDGTPGAREFLTRAVAQANADRVWAEKGLERLKSNEGKK